MSAVALEPVASVSLASAVVSGVWSAGGGLQNVAGGPSKSRGRVSSVDIVGRVLESVGASSRVVSFRC